MRTNCSNTSLWFPVVLQKALFFACVSNTVRNSSSLDSVLPHAKTRTTCRELVLCARGSALPRFSPFSFVSKELSSHTLLFACVSNTVQNSSTLDSVLFHVKARNHLSRACSLCKGKRADPLFFRFQKARAHSSHPKHDTQLSERVTTKKRTKPSQKEQRRSCHCSTWFCAVEVHGFGL